MNSVTYQLKDRDSWIVFKKARPNYMLLTKNSFKMFNRLQINKWRKICRENTNQKKAGMAILISDKVDFRSGRAQDPRGI